MSLNMRASPPRISNFHALNVIARFCLSHSRPRWLGRRLRLPTRTLALDHASPAAGSSARRPPREVTLWLTEKAEPAFSSVTVTNAAGNRVGDGKIAVYPHNAQELHVALQPLAPGVYEVHWQRLSADKHQTQGQF